MLTCCSTRARTIRIGTQLMLLVLHTIYHPVLTTSDHCPQRRFDHCKMPSGGSFHHREGYRCRNLCVTRQAWCDAAFAQNGCRGPDESNALLSSCTHYHFTRKSSAKRFSYVVVQAQVPWSVAKDYCQVYGDDYHLLAIESEAELRILGPILYQLVSDPRNVKLFPYDSFYDPLGIQCADAYNQTKTEFFHHQNFWLGLQKNPSEGARNWESVDGRRIHAGIPNLHFRAPDDTGTSSGDNIKEKALGDFMDKIDTEDCHGCLKIGTHLAVNIQSGFHIVKTPSLPSIRRQNYQAAIICKRRHLTKSPNVEQLPAHCATGYTCPRPSPAIGNPRQCLIGYGYEESQLCDGRHDCADAADESLDNWDPERRGACPSVHVTRSKRETAEATDNYVYVGVRHNYLEAHRFCASKGWKLPSLHSEAQRAILTNLPKIFLNHYTSKDKYILKTHNFYSNDTMGNLIFLGRNLTSTIHEDGTKVNFDAQRDDLSSVEPNVVPEHCIIALDTRTGQLHAISRFNTLQTGFVCQTGRWRQSGATTTRTINSISSTVCTLVAILLAILTQ